MAELNKQQMEAVLATEPYLLCSAGAGSGKTTVMISSIAHKLATDKKSISTFLIITFTNEAAANMKRKLREKLGELAQAGKDYAKRGLADLENASISTIHAFCKGLISSYFYAIPDMPPKFEIIEEARLERIFREAYETALDDICGEDSTYPEDQVSLVKDVMDSFGQAELVNMCRSLYKALMGIPDPFEHLDSYIDGITLPPDENVWVQEILFSVRMDLMSLEAFIKNEQAMICDITPKKCEEAAEKDREVITELLEMVEAEPSIEELIDALKTANDQMPNTTVNSKGDEALKEWNEGFKALRNEVKGSKGCLLKDVKLLEKLQKPSQVVDNERIQRTLRGMAILLKATSEHFRRMKLEAQGIDYSDMEQMVYELTKRPEICRAIKEDISDIYVDECQDVSAIQHAIINALSGDEGRSLCRVGDIKQSIYGFRSAAPDIMERDIEDYSIDKGAEHRKIFFQENYRSCERIIDCVNEVFTMCMDKRISEIDYTPDDMLRANIHGDYPPVKVMLITKDGDLDNDGRIEAQCEAVGRQIQELVANGRALKDIVILIRANADAPVIVEHLRKMHIPVHYDGGESFYGLSEISSFISLLTVIDNDHTDTELIGALRNVPFCFTDEELALIRDAKPDRCWYYEAFRYCCQRDETELDRKCIAARERIHDWRERCRILDLSEIVWMLMRESGIYAVRGAYPDGRLRQLNLDSFYGRAVEMQKRGIIRLSDFLREIGKLRTAPSGDTGDTPASLGESDQLVRLMTMHKSKGLEFKTVFLMQLHKNMHQKPPKTKMRLNVGTSEGSGAPLGVYVPVVSRKRHTKRQTFGYDAFSKRARRSTIAEESRLLYVAMTRAMEELIMVGDLDDKAVDRWQEENKLSRIWNTKSMLDLIMPAVLPHTGLPEVGETSIGGQWQLTVAEPRRIVSDEHPTPESVLDDNIRAVIASGAARPDMMWTGGTVDGSPLKTSVTSLLRDMETHPERYSPWSEEEETPETKRQPEHKPGALLSEIPSRPKFMEEEKASATDIGSATHRFLRLIDLSLFRWGGSYRSIVTGEIERMKTAGILSETEAKTIYAKGAAGFLESELGQELIAAEEIRREWPFTMQIDDSSPTMIQGIIDAAFLYDGQWILLDYKTDRDTREEVFVPRHERQMNWYRIAVERLTGIPVREMWLYALRAEQAFPVARMDPIR